MYGGMLKLAKLSHFWQVFAISKKVFGSELLNQAEQNCRFSKHKKFLISGEKFDSKTTSFWVQEMAKTKCTLYLKWLIYELIHTVG